MIRWFYLGIVVALWAVVPALAYAAGPIVLNGQFGDWAGQAAVNDSQGDAASAALDIQQFGFATNPNVSASYFMAQRWVASSADVWFALFIDTDNNGIYTDVEDDVVTVHYQPKNGTSQVDIFLYDGQGRDKQRTISNVDWGASIGEGGRQVEWGVDWADLGIVAGQPIRMILTADDKQIKRFGDLDRAADTTAEAQWSPADALGTPLVIALALLGGCGLAYQRWRSHSRGVPL